MATAAEPPIGSRPQRTDVRRLCVLVADLERRMGRSHPGLALIEDYEVALLLRVAEALAPKALAAVRAPGPKGARHGQG